MFKEKNREVKIEHIEEFKNGKKTVDKFLIQVGDNLYNQVFCSSEELKIIREELSKIILN